MPPTERASGPVRLVLFDLDGTFADTLPDLAAALNRVLTDAGRAPLPAESMRRHVTQGARAMVAHAFADVDDESILARHRARFLDLYRENVACATRPFPGVEALVAALDARGVRWGIVTNKLATFTEPLIAAIPLAAGAACVVSGDCAPRAKPAPDPLLLACDRAGLPAATGVYVGDAATDIVSAHAAGMPACVAGWGYLPADEDTRAWDPDGWLTRPEDLLDWLDTRAADSRR